MRGEGGEVGAEEGSEGHRKQLAEGQTPLCLCWGCPWGLGGGECVAPLLLIGQFTLLYPLLPPFWGDGGGCSLWLHKASWNSSRKRTNSWGASKFWGRRNVWTRVIVSGQSVPGWGRRAGHQADFGINPSSPIAATVWPWAGNSPAWA